jgi:hypothetical protein
MGFGFREINQRMSDRETWLHETDYLKFDDGLWLSDVDPELWFRLVGSHARQQGLRLRHGLL